MRTKRMIRASFSGNPPKLNISLPESWDNLSQTELRGVYRILVQLAPQTDEELRILVLRYLARLRVITRNEDKYMCRIVARDGKRRRVLMVSLSAHDIVSMLEPLEFLSDPGRVPVRIESWHGVGAVDAELHGLSFGDYLQLENLYQGFMASKDSETVLSMAQILYPGIKPKHVGDMLAFNILQWLVQVKGLFSQMWPHFFKPAKSGAVAPSMLEVMNNEIRALTGGDVTKEEVIFATECWRALTELDYKAQEAEEFNRQQAKLRK